MKVLENGIYRDATAEELAEMNQPLDLALEIEQLKAQLAETDYKAIKFAEGWLTEEEYAPIKAERQALRDAINDLEKQPND